MSKIFDTSFLFVLLHAKSFYIIKTILIILLAISTFCGMLPAQQKNPLLDMVGKPYSEYHDTYMSVIGSLLHKDSTSRVELVHLFNEAARVDNTEEWEFIKCIVENIVRFYESRNGGYIWSSEYTAEDYAENMIIVARRAEKKEFVFIKILGLYQAAEAYSIFAHNYERSFTLYLEIASELETISTKDFPPRPYIYNQIAALYYTFREYEDAIIYYSKNINDPYSSCNYYKSYYPAMNGLGLCYRYGSMDYERSDSCFKKILEQVKSNDADRKVWDGIAEGNIGYNYYLQDNPDTALLWLIPSIEKITRPNDFQFKSSRATNVANIYLKKNEPELAKKYIDIALDYHYKTLIPEKDNHLYNVLSEYYIYTGDKQKAIAYHDSTVMAVNRENEAFSGLVLRRVEQQLRSTDRKLHEQEINTEQEISRTYKQITILVSVALVTILLLLGSTLFFYRRKRNAYRELVRQNQAWAGIHISEGSVILTESTQNGNEYVTTGNENLTAIENISEEGDPIMMEKLNHLMQTEKLYRKPDLTLPETADKLNTNRTYLSKTINAIEKKNFTIYINELRIKDAVILLSDSKNIKYSMDYIAEEVGFTNRTTFSQVFKKITGLTPTEFRKNNS